LKTTHRLLPPESRTLGNSVLQSGTAIGAIVTPVIMGFLLTSATGSWRPAFQIIAGVGLFWVVAWLLSTNSRDLAPIAATALPTDPAAATGDGVVEGDSFWAVIFGRKFLVLVFIVAAINAGAQLFRAWMPLFLQSGRGYDEEFMLKFMFFYYVANDIGCLSGGYVTRRLHQAGFSVHASRTAVFGVCAVLVAAGGLIPWLPAGPGLITALMIVALGSLGLFPCFYSFCQDLSTRHQGKVLGLLGTIAWVTTAPLHILLGRWVDQTKSYDLGMSLVCGLPLVALFVLMLFWPEEKLEPKYDPAASLA
jgi:ACS family hexuronate transporter-like MFS transporter